MKAHPIFIILIILFLILSCEKDNSEINEPLKIIAKNDDPNHDMNASQNTKHQIPEKPVESNIKEQKERGFNAEIKKGSVEYKKVTDIIKLLFEDDYHKNSIICNDLIAYGNKIQQILFEYFDDDEIYQYIHRILAEVGDVECLERFINNMSESEFSRFDKTLDAKKTFSCLNSIHRMIRKHIGNGFTITYSPEVKQIYQKWFNDNKDFLYVSDYTQSKYYLERIAIDFEAKLFGKSTKEYRQQHPWIQYSDVMDWKDELNLNKRLIEFCYSILLMKLSHPDAVNNELHRNTILYLGDVKDDRIVDILQRLTHFVNIDSFVAATLIGVIKDRCNANSILYLEQFKKSKNHDYAMEAIRDLRDKAEYGEDYFTQYHLKNDEGREELIDRLKNSIHEYYPYYIEIAGQLKDDRIVPILKKIMDKDNADFKHLYINHLYPYSKNNGDQLKIRTALALVKQGEDEYLDYLRGKLKSDYNSIKLAAAIALWELKNKEGFNTLMDLIKIRDIEKGNEYRNSLGFHGANVTIVRTACEILGEMGDKKAIPELKKLLKLNLNGVAGEQRPHSGTAFVGRPDAVALVKLGDKSGEEFLLKRLMDSNFQEGTIKDLEKLNKRKYIKNLIPILDSRGDRVTAAIAIINLLTVGK